ncbi:MAG: hypothetical protein JWM78_2263 [Verrucomicrobiaceae bacterium]|nr:hypothetical protein [Verrucomicrobiaceae bacterium]
MASETDAALSALDLAQQALDKSPVAAVALTQPWSKELVQFLAISVLGFSGIALIMATALLWRASAPPQQVLRVFGVISILGFSALLLVVGYNNEQLTPIVGLFGAIAGYLLGKDSKSDKGE